MPQPDYENDLVFPPKGKLYEKRKNNLTEDFKRGRLKSGWYFCEILSGDEETVIPVYLLKIGYCLENGKVIEVLAPCDYDELQRLKEENNTLSALVTGNELENDKLRELLKECKPFLNAWLGDEADVPFTTLEVMNFLTRINAALGDSA